MKSFREEFTCVANDAHWNGKKDLILYLFHLKFHIYHSCNPGIETSIFGLNIFVDNRNSCETLSTPPYIQCSLQRAMLCKQIKHWHQMLIHAFMPNYFEAILERYSLHFGKISVWTISRFHVCLIFHLPGGCYKTLAHVKSVHGFIQNFENAKNISHYQPKQSVVCRVS